MSRNVFVNGREVSCKKDDNKSLCAMPDVCLSPPSPPAGPVPIPYPNTAKAADTADGSKTVKVGGAEVGQKNSSNYKKSMGDEAATKSLGMGVVTHTIQDKMKHAAWSMDVKIEGANAIRHMDLTTHNHMNTNNSGSMILNQAKQKVAEGKPLSCQELDALNKESRRKDIMPAKKKKGEFTLTTASFTPPPPATKSFFMKATAPGRTKLIRSDKRNGYAGTNKKTTMSCTNEPYGGARGGANATENEMTRNHSEPKLIESLGEGGGTLLMKIHHQTSPRKVDAMPCNSCKNAICRAVNCGLDIQLCNDKNEAVEPPCNRGQPAPESEWAARGLG